MITIRRDREIFDTEGGWFRARLTIRAWHPSELILVDLPMRFEAVGHLAGTHCGGRPGPIVRVQLRPMSD